MITRAIGLAALALLGCASDEPRDGELSPPPTPTACAGLAIADPNPALMPGQCRGGFFLGNFRDGEVQLIRDVGYEWNNFAGRPLVHLGAASACAIIPGELPGSQVASHKDGVITVDMRRLRSGNPIDKVLYPYVIKHEIGRAMGMQPTNAAAGVMSTCTSDGVFGKEDLTECRRLGLCY